MPWRRSVNIIDESKNAINKIVTFKPLRLYVYACLYKTIWWIILIASKSIINHESNGQDEAFMSSLDCYNIASISRLRLYEQITYIEGINIWSSSVNKASRNAMSLLFYIGNVLYLLSIIVGNNRQLIWYHATAWRKGEKIIDGGQNQDVHVFDLQIDGNNTSEHITSR